MEFLKESIANKKNNAKGRLIAVLINNLSLLINFLKKNEAMRKPIKVLVNAGATDIEKGIITME